MIEIEKDYFVTKEGRVFSKRKFNSITELKQYTAGYQGYAKVKIDLKHMFVHRLVAMAYIDNPEDKKTVNHIDGNKLNNHVDNLEWNTHKENITHAIKTGLKLPYKGIKNRGNNKFAKKWLELSKNKISYRKIAKIYNVSHHTVIRTLNKFKLK